MSPAAILLILDIVNSGVPLLIALIRVSKMSEKEVIEKVQESYAEVQKLDPADLKRV